MSCYDEDCEGSTEYLIEPLVGNDVLCSCGDGEHVFQGVCRIIQSSGYPAVVSEITP